MERRSFGDSIRLAARPDHAHHRHCFDLGGGAAYICGTDQQPLQLPAYLSGSLAVWALRIAVYRLILIGLARLSPWRSWLGIENTRFGAKVRAAVDNEPGARPRHQRRSALRHGVRHRQRAGRARRRAGDRDRRPRPVVRTDYLIYVLIVVSVGGHGSIAGAFGAASCSASAMSPASTTFPRSVRSLSISS